MYVKVLEGMYDGVVLFARELWICSSVCPRVYDQWIKSRCISKCKGYVQGSKGYVQGGMSNWLFPMEYVHGVMSIGVCTKEYIFKLCTKVMSKRLYPVLCPRV